MAPHHACWFALALVGCGGRVSEPTASDPPAPAAALDAGRGALADTGVGSGADAVPVDGGIGGATDASPDAAPTPPPGPDDGPRIVSLAACGSAPGVDKILVNLSEPVGPVAAPTETLHVSPGGTTCPDVFDDRSPDGEYAFGAKCGPIDRTQPIVVTVGVGITSLAGKPMRPGTYVFRPAGTPGRLCGDAFVP